MTQPSSDVAFTPAVKAVQSRRGSRALYARAEARGGFETVITEELAAFLSSVDTAYLATASADGQPYAQHRGGPKGFIRVIDEHTLGFADFLGNRQYISTGNLAENDRAFLFLMDYAHRRRIKLWGRARVVEGDAALQARLMPEGYKARPEQAILFTVAAWDMNCPQHIPQKFDAADVSAAIQRLQDRIAALEAENETLHARISAAGGRDAADRPGAPMPGTPMPGAPMPGTLMDGDAPGAAG
jgi:predicted pyridoxine 5'-phosphate oxidase superfamily flavin-nucleotide-binding protein